MALFNFGKKKEEEKKTPACACSCGCAASEAESITNDCCPDLKEGEICCIKVLAGCKSCHEQFEYTKQAVKDMGLSVEVEYITDMQKVMEYGVMSMPALVVNEKVVATIFLVCRYFRRIYRLPRTLDTLDTLFSQSTRIEKTFPFSLSRALVQKKVCQVCQMVVLPDEHGKSTETLKFSQVCQKSTTFPYSPINWGKF